MNRRDLIKYGAILSAMVARPAAAAKDRPPQVAFTFDDPKTATCANLKWQQINERILAALARHRIKAVLFVTGKRVDSQGGRSLVSEWDRSGHAIGNHSYSHLSFNTDDVTLTQFEMDVLKDEPLVRDYPHFVRLFRFPYFKEGSTVEKRDDMRSFLHQHGYKVGRATIDASDWAISARLEKRAGANPNAELAPYGEFFKQHIWDRAQYYDSLARQTLKRTVRHTLVLHHNALNAFFLDQLIEMFIDKGWSPIDALDAYADCVYELQPKILPAGENLIWALAKQTGKLDSELRYPGEDEVYENPKMDALGL